MKYSRAEIEKSLRGNRAYFEKGLIKMGKCKRFVDTCIRARILNVRRRDYRHTLKVQYYRGVYSRNCSRWSKQFHSQVILPLESLAAHRADVFPLVAVRQLVFCQSRGVAEYLGTDLQQIGKQFGDDIDCAFTRPENATHVGKVVVACSCDQLIIVCSFTFWQHFLWWKISPRSSTQFNQIFRTCKSTRNSILVNVIKKFSRLLTCKCNQTCFRNRKWIISADTRCVWKVYNLVYSYLEYCHVILKVS